MENTPSQRSMRAVYMRGGTSKGLFIDSRDMPPETRYDPVARDRMLLTLMGSPDPYGKQIDGMGGATPGTSKVVIASPSERDDCNVSYRFGAVSIDKPVIDSSNNCVNLTAAVGPFALFSRLVSQVADGPATVRLWQENIGQLSSPVFRLKMAGQSKLARSNLTALHSRLRKSVLNLSKKITRWSSRLVIHVKPWKYPAAGRSTLPSSARAAQQSLSMLMHSN
jgi:PrpF protein